MSLKRRFFDAIAALTPGNRDANLVRVATYGVRAGLSAEEVAEAIMQNAPGETRPDPVAVRRAVENCYGATSQTARDGSSWHIKFDWSGKTEDEKRAAFRENLPVELRESVRRLVEASKGATPDDLILRSPTPIPLDPREQAAAFIRTLCADWRWVSWFGCISSRGKRGLIAEPYSVAYAIETSLCPKIPTHMTLNPLTGRQGFTKEGRPSYDCAATVAALRFCLVEFDEMPVADQLALWASVVNTMRDEVPLLSIVYSGSKSLHAVVLCPPATRADLAREEIAESDKLRWLDSWDCLLRRFASSPRPPERMDPSPSKNAAIHTRVPGAVRPETGRHQKLLYLDTELARENLELF